MRGRKPKATKVKGIALVLPVKPPAMGAAKRNARVSAATNKVAAGLRAPKPRKPGA